MRGLTAFGVVVATGGLAAGSEYLIRRDAPAFIPYLVYFWLVVGALALAGLLWLYLQIAIGPRVTVSERKAMSLERSLAKVQGSKKKSHQKRQKRITEEAAALADLIEPVAEAHNVFVRRVRLANSVLALIVVLTASFWIFAAMAPQVWPSQHWFADSDAPDPYHAALFSVDQVTRGTLFDLFDVFDWSISGYHNDPHNKWFSAFIVIYRFLMSGAFFAAIAVRLGMREDWHEKAAHSAATQMKERLTKLASA